MSGYLQRMAASVARPARTVHPLMTGLFAKESSAELGPEPGGLETVRTSPHMVSAEVQQQQPVEAVQEQTSPARRDEESARSRQTPWEKAPAITQDVSISPREPLVPGWKPEAMPERKVERTTEHITMETISDAHRVREEPGEVSVEVAKSREQSANIETMSFAPSITQVKEVVWEDVTPSPTREHKLPPATTRAVDIRRAAVPQQHSRRDEAQRGGEDIQIHIGRIEVIAVPQPVQRATPAKTQRGETLEAYLKRHERRSR